MGVQELGLQQLYVGRVALLLTLVRCLRAVLDRLALQPKLAQSPDVETEEHRFAVDRKQAHRTEVGHKREHRTEAPRKQARRTEAGRKKARETEAGPMRVAQRVGRKRRELLRPAS